jgi:ATP-dependent Clp protease ATP-binding subunit ClpA
MFERFTDRARRVVVLAQEEARKLNHSYIGTEHLLLGLVREGEGVAARALESLGISLQAVRRDVEEMVGRGPQPAAGHIPFTPRAKKVLELSLRESNQLGHNYIGTEHILLGMLREGEGVAAQVLVKMGTDLNRARQRVIELLHGRPGKGDQGPLAAEGGFPPAGDVLARLNALDRRLEAIERWVGMRPDLSKLAEDITRVRREKEAAIEAQDFNAAAALRDEERELEAQRDAREQGHATGPSLAGEIERFRAELERMDGILRDRGIEPGDDAASG